MKRLAPLLSWLAFPAYVWQGLGVRRRTARMLPASGPVRHRIEGAEPEMALLVIGDSSAACESCSKRSIRALANSPYKLSN